MMFTKTREKRNKTIPFGRVGTEYPEIKEAFDRLDLLIEEVYGGKVSKRRNVHLCGSCSSPTFEERVAAIEEAAIKENKVLKFLKGAADKLKVLGNRLVEKEVR